MRLGAKMMAAQLEIFFVCSLWRERRLGEHADLLVLPLRDERRVHLQRVSAAAGGTRRRARRCG
jgi:hypothetical protein